MSLAVLFITNMGFWSTLAIDIPNLMRETGDSIEQSSAEDGLLVFHIRKAAA